MNNPIGKSYGHVAKPELDMCFAHLFTRDALLHPGNENPFAFPQQDERGIVKLHQVGVTLPIHLHHGEGGVSHLAYLAHGQRGRDGLHHILDLGAG